MTIFLLPLPPLFAVALSYLLGSVSFAVLVSRLLRLSDPRTYGSGNPGATNVLRSGNRLAAFLTLIGDAGKGAAAVWVGHAWAQAPLWLAAGCGAAAFAGHLFPLFLRFHGGKGVATYLGVLLALDWRIGLCACAVWLALALVSRYSSLASMCAALAAPLIAILSNWPWQDTALLSAMSALLLWRHRSNLANLRAGREGRIGAGRAGGRDSGGR